MKPLPIEIETHLQELWSQLHSKFSQMARIWQANAILNDSYEQTFSKFKDSCLEICLEYLKYKLNNFDSQLYLENIIQYLNHLIQNLIDSISES